MYKEITLMLIVRSFYDHKTPLVFDYVGHVDVNVLKDIERRISNAFL